MGIPRSVTLFVLTLVGEWVQVRGRDAGLWGTVMLRAWVVGVYATLLLSGCVATGAIDRRATDINLGVGDTLNRALLLNLARASRSEPLYFLSLSGAHGSATEDARIGLPAIIFGPAQTAAEHQFVFGGGTGPNLLDNQITTSFDVGVLNSKDFYAGLLTPLGLQDVNLLLSQGYARELVLYLVIDNIKVTDVTDRNHETSTIFYNDPSRPHYFDDHPDDLSTPNFERLIGAAMTHGLTTETVTPLETADQEDAERDRLQKAGAEIGHVGAISAAKKDNGGREDQAGSRGRHESPHVRLCYDTALATSQAGKDFLPDSPRCGAPPADTAQGRVSSAKLAVNLYHRQFEIEVRTRSIFGLFNYLGGLIARDELGMVHLRRYDLPSEVTVDAPLLTMTDRHESCFTAITYGGRRYCVPNEGADNTKKIFNIMNALLALKTAPGDLPITQTVRITP